MIEDPRARADAAEQLLKQPLDRAEAYRGLPPERAERRRLCDAAAILAPDDPIEPGDLDDLRRLWAWAMRQDTSIELWEPGEPPTDDAARLLLEGREDLCPRYDEEDRELPPENDCLADEQLEAWVAIGHLHDGHRFYVWDTSKSPDVVVYGIDNSDRHVFMSAFESIEEVLRRLLLDAMISTLRYRNPPPPPPMSTRDKLGCAACVLAGFAALALLVWWLV